MHEENLEKCLNCDRHMTKLKPLFVGLEGIDQLELQVRLCIYADCPNDPVITTLHEPDYCIEF